MEAVGTVEVDGIMAAMDRDGFWVSPPLVDIRTCEQLAHLYSGGEETFRSTINMARHGF
jgi:hypothetical protein